MLGPMPLASFALFMAASGFDGWRRPSSASSPKSSGWSGHSERGTRKSRSAPWPGPGASICAYLLCPAPQTDANARRGDCNARGRKARGPRTCRRVGSAPRGAAAQLGPSRGLRSTERIYLAVRWRGLEGTSPQPLRTRLFRPSQLRGHSWRSDLHGAGLRCRWHDGHERRGPDQVAAHAAQSGHLLPAADRHIQDSRELTRACRPCRPSSWP